MSINYSTIKICQYATSTFLESAFHVNFMDDTPRPHHFSYIIFLFVKKEKLKSITFVLTTLTIKYVFF